MSKFGFNEKDVKFIFECISKYGKENHKQLKSITSENEMDIFNEGLFDYMMNRMLKSEDKEIKIELSRKLMYSGLMDFNRKVAIVNLSSIMENFNGN